MRIRLSLSMSLLIALSAGSTSTNAAGGITLQGKLPCSLWAEGRVKNQSIVLENYLVGREVSGSD